MKVFAIVPVKKFENAKTRLSSILSTEARTALSLIMLEETIRVLTAAGSQVERTIVVSSDQRARKVAESFNAVFLQEENDNGVNSAVSLGNAYSADHAAEATLVVPQDLPLLSAPQVSALCDLASNEDKCVVICPSQRYDGTNLLLRKPPDVIDTFFDRDSYENHISASSKQGVPLKVFFSDSLMLDIDTPEDVRQLINNPSYPRNRVLQFLVESGLKRTA